MDLEGHWFGKILGNAPKDVMLEIDGQAVNLTEWECRDHCVLSSSLPYPSLAWAAWSRVPPIISLGGTSQDSVSADGMGWVLAEECSIWLDGNPSPVTVPEHIGPLFLPFWNGFRCDKPRPWIRIPWSLAPLFDSKDEERSLIFEKASAEETLTALDAAGRRRTDSSRSVLGRASFHIYVPTEADHLILRRSYDAFHGMQRARILVNGEMICWWHQPEESRESRWAQDDLILPVLQDDRGQKVEISIEPPAGAPLFSIARIECWATIPQR